MEALKKAALHLQPPTAAMAAAAATPALASAGGMLPAGFQSPFPFDAFVCPGFVFCLF